jgi:DNA-binding NarL/FixJ family response regulator
MALGLSTKQITYELRRSPKTIAAHRAEIMQRLRIRDIAGLVIYALR